MPIITEINRPSFISADIVACNLVVGDGLAEWRHDVDTVAAVARNNVALSRCISADHVIRAIIDEDAIAPVSQVNRPGSIYADVINPMCKFQDESN